MKTEFFQDGQAESESPSLDGRPEYSGERRRISDLVAGMQKRSPRVSREAMRQMIRCAQNGDGKVLNQLIEMNSPLVLSTLHRMPGLISKPGRHLKYADYFQFGVEGLREAILRYDPARGQFTTCGTPWIRKYILQGVREFEREVRFPGHVHEFLPRVYLMEDKLQSIFERAPTNQEIADALGVKPQVITESLGFDRAYIKCDYADETPPDGVASPLDGHMDKSALCPEERAISNSLMQTAFAPLTQRERLLISRRFGLHGLDVHSRAKCAAAMKLPTHEVRAMEKVALAKMRAQWPQEN